MKRIGSLLAIIITIGLIGCKKETLPGEVSVKLSATTYYKDGSEETHYERSGTIEKTSYAGLVNDGSGYKYLVNLGAAGQAPHLSTFGVSFLFNEITTPAGINGTFSFPKDQLMVRTLLRNEITATGTEFLEYPTRGTASLHYDSTAKTISGSVKDLEFSIVPNDPFGRYRVTINGSFANVPVQ